ncbi:MULTISPECIES: hypothetical protein [unclassified Tenacibaculum]|uniref:hypothetical protein n=1 Tax=unclassified Tenacibaculum TaxID=2635139 RepID=UPI001F46DE31|nr:MULTISPECIES: hypothetical protein [unclassified Tenacibaculum]MCF2875515.1 hypothetical protein [Tenacibaculum sp. Cn5-1]MCF2935591.1 hypothetical protein [Tenacibaculum sp. Cn5-34]MCG7512151.1 hypothetical protein [Tenacibaculum sp. Cn5-46]
MKKSILNLGKALNKVEQKSINGGTEGEEDNGPNGQGCYKYRTTAVNCISPWIYAPGCGWVCMVAPEGP